MVAAGGLHIIGTERHDARRIDNQLRGRAGRQGDPGSSRFYLSLEDTLMKRFASDRVTGLMERMGLKDDVAIESRLVSKTIENAQSRVEGYNFDIRKRVVEYDDVINKQRETIYAERDKVLRNEDLTETVRDFVARARSTCSPSCTLAPSIDDWDLEGLARAVRGPWASRRRPQRGGPGRDRDREAIVESLLDAADQVLERKEQQYGAEVWALVERLVLLRTIDQLWVDHLTELDDFRRGVGLRGYGGTDPLNEFKREAFQLYEELRGFIRHQVASTIFRVSVQRQEAAAPAAHGHAVTGGARRAARHERIRQWQQRQWKRDRRRGRGHWHHRGRGSRIRSGGCGTDGGLIQRGCQRDASRARRATLRSHEAPEGRRRGRHGSGQAGQPASAAKLGRNDPCWCGSGKKYKKCHGT